jgi:AraC family transcriptional regulator of adaptative response / DNA-3-methyladenine glycosylase II
MLARDARFDGRFFTGVLTTGIYCRPVCPVRQPKLANVRFFRTAAAAAEAGLRPCLRCRPEASPGTPAWLGTEATVARALKLIAGGALDRGSVADLAGRLGVGPRHLGRLFRRHVGAAPLSVAKTRRLHLSKRLLDETDLSMTEVSLASGFGSVRRFNTTVRGTYGQTPSELRRAARREPAARSGDRLTLRLSYRPPFDWASLVAFLAARAIPGVEQVTPGSYRRTIRTGDRSGVLEVVPVADRDELELRLDVEPGELVDCINRVRRIFDLDAVPDEIAEHLRSDPWIAAHVDSWPGLRLPGAWDGFEVAVRAILGQQVSVKGATTLSGRLASRFGEVRTPSGEPGLERLFPRPEVLATADLTGIGLPGARARAINAFAHAVSEARLSLEPATDLDRFVGEMTSLPGIGEWTAQYVAMRALGEPDAFPSSDLGLLQSVSSPGSRVTPRDLAMRSERWRPWRSYAAVYLWKAHATKLVLGKPSSVYNNK